MMSIYDHSSSRWRADVVTWHTNPSTYPRFKWQDSQMLLREGLSNTRICMALVPH